MCNIGVSKSFIVSIEPIGCFCVLVMMFLHSYFEESPGFSYLFGKKVLLCLVLCVFLYTILFLGSECRCRFFLAAMVESTSVVFRVKNMPTMLQRFPLMHLFLAFFNSTELALQFV